ncbi:TetR/AcrR family transcriptional regulator [Tamaricihabitans halophyticus]|nr:TetR/AcrR family transcriptional regulator [Tamaricihabitans halophyticus]
MQVSGAPKGLRTDARRNRDALLTAARAEFAKHGLWISDERIARSAGVGTATLRRHFPDRGALFDEVYLPAMEAEVDLLERSLCGTGRKEDFSWFFANSLDRLTDNQVNGDLLFTPMPTAVRVEAAKKRLHQLMATYLRRCRDAGYFRAGLTIPDVALCTLAHRHVVAQTNAIAPNTHRRFAQLIMDACRATSAPALDTPPMNDEQLRQVLMRRAKQRWQLRKQPSAGTTRSTERANNREHRATRNLASRNRQALLLAAKAEFSAVGFRASLETIAKRAGVGIGTLYRHFPTRADLIDALYLRTLEERSTMVEEALALPNAMEGLAWYFIRSNEQLADDISSRDLVITQLPAGTASAEAKQRLRPKVIELLSKGQREGSIRADFTPGDVALYGLGITHVMWETREAAPAAWRRFCAIMMDALRPEHAHELTGPAMTYEQLIELSVHRAHNF